MTSELKICVACDAPVVSRSCKTYPVTQTKENNWTGEASKRITGMNQVVCDVAVRTICVASDAPVSRSCKTYPVTQTKENNWTGEASLRSGKSQMRGRVLRRHLEGIW